MATPKYRTKIGIVGRGKVAAALEGGWKKAGHDVRTVGKEPKKVAALGPWSEVIVLAVPFSERFNALSELGDIRGKTVIDVTNSIGPNMTFGASIERSGAEELQAKADGVHIVKAFNTVFAQNMATGRVKGQSLSAFVAGDHAASRQKVSQLATDLGFEAVDAGPLAAARWLETMGYFSIQLAYVQKLGADIGLKLVR